MSDSRGFTLIELLVVIAIIGILSSVVLASLNTARGKGADTAIKGNLAGIRTQAEIYYDGNSNSYGTQASSTITSSTGVCGGAGIFSDANVTAALKSAMSQTGDTAKGYCVANGTYWSIAVPLKTDNTSSWCVSSAGKAQSITTAATAAAFVGCL